MTQRDDDPVHPNWDGIAFHPSTDRSGVVATPTSALSTPPYTYMTITDAVTTLGDIRAVIYGLESKDRRSYLAWFLGVVADDLADAIELCRPKEEDPDDAPSRDVPGPAA